MTAAERTDADDVPEFLNVTLYTEDISELREFYHGFLGLPIEYEEAGHIAVMGRVAVHDATEGPVGTRRLYFFVNDPVAFASRAEPHGVSGVLRADGHGNPAWESTDPLGNSVVLLKRPAAE